MQLQIRNDVKLSTLSILNVKRCLLLAWLLILAPVFLLAQVGGMPDLGDTLEVSPVDSFIRLHHLPPLLDSTFIIRNILIEGNTITRRTIMLRELPFKEGDSIRIKDFPLAFKTGKKHLLNTTLFHEANFSVAAFELPYVDIKITVKERWYIFPFPHFKPVDRNLNQWLFEKGASLARVDYGVKLMYNNVTGNNDNLRFYFVTGYTKQLMMSYHRPFIDRNLEWGMNIDVAVGKSKEVNYNTINDKQQFLKYNQYLRNFFNSRLEFTYRPAFYTIHSFGITYNTLNLADTILKLNPNYLTGGKTHVQYPEIYYRVAYQNLDYIPYPTKGYAWEIYFEKHGFDRDMNLWQLNFKGVGNWHLTKNTFYSISAMGTLKLPFKQPFYNSRLLGYGDMFLRGYEYYVVDGVAGGLVNASLSRQLTNFSLHIPHTKWLTARLVPLKIYGKIYGNTGYVYNERPGENQLPKTLLYGGGFGLDIFTMYDFTLKLEFSFNQLQQNGLYLQKKSMF